MDAVVRGDGGEEASDGQAMVQSAQRSQLEHSSHSGPLFLWLFIELL